jgi:hypothetical protein
MGGNIAGIYGAQIFRRDDRPLYKRGFAVNISILVAGLLLAVVRYVDDRIRRRRAPVLQSTPADSDNGISKGDAIHGKEENEEVKEQVALGKAQGIST